MRIYWIKLEKIRTKVVTGLDHLVYENLYLQLQIFSKLDDILNCIWLIFIHTQISKEILNYNHMQAYSHVDIRYNYISLSIVLICNNYVSHEILYIIFVCFSLSVSIFHFNDNVHFYFRFEFIYFYVFSTLSKTFAYISNMVDYWLKLKVSQNQRLTVTLSSCHHLVMTKKKIKE